MMLAKQVGWKAPPGSLSHPMVIAHRGGSDLAPENTLAAFRNAVEVGADAIELDVRLTKDRRVAVFHDRRIDRTTTGSGTIGTLTMEELKNLDAGSWYGREYAGERVPSLEDVFEAVPEDFPVYVEMKARGPNGFSLASAVVDVVRRCRRWDSTMVASFNPWCTLWVRASESRIVRGYIWAQRHPLPLRARWLGPLVDAQWLAPDRDTFSPGLLRRSHSRGKRVAALDTDVGRDMGRLKELGLDGVVTDDPVALVRGR
jgi:glycerophosphoryl diester phosphodiesterase